MKKTNILDFFKSESQSSKVPCPACGTSILKSKLNYHLDSLCISATQIPVSSKPVDNVEHSLKTSIPKRNAAINSKRLCLKSQRSKNSSKHTKKLQEKSKKAETETSDDEIVFLEEVEASPKKLKCNQIEKSLKSVENQPVKIENINCTKDNLIVKNPCKSVDDLSLSRDSSISPPVNKDISQKATDFFSNGSTSLKRKKSLRNELSSESNSTVDTKQMTSKRKKSKKNHSVSNDLKSDETDDSDSKQLLSNGPPSTEIVVDPISTSSSQNEKVYSETQVKSISTDTKNSHENMAVLNNGLNPELTDSILNDAKLISENDVFSELSDSAEKKDSKSYTPYYIANFKYILEAVLNDPGNQILFNEEDKQHIKAFKAASGTRFSYITI